MPDGQSQQMPMSVSVFSLQSSVFPSFGSLTKMLNRTGLTIGATGFALGIPLPSSVSTDNCHLLSVNF